MQNRRDFIVTTLATIGAAAFRPGLSWARPAPKTILILGFPGLSIFQVMEGRTAGYSRFDTTPELKAGITFRATEVTAKDTLDWFRTFPENRQATLLSGLAREARILAAWKAGAGRGI